jgi:uncharacterized protein YxjI
MEPALYPPHLDTCQGFLAYQALYVKQDSKNAWLEALTGCVVENKFKIFAATPNGEKAQLPVLKVKESSTCFQQLCCGSSRGFQMTLTTNEGQEILQLDAPFKWQCCCGACDPRVLYVKSGSASKSPGVVLGSIEDGFSILSPNLAIKNEIGDIIYRLTGEACPCCHCSYSVQIMDMKGNQVGEITKKWGGCTKEVFTDSDNFHVIFPVSADPKQRALILGAVFLVDMMYFENDEDGEGLYVSDFLLECDFRSSLMGP